MNEASQDTAVDRVVLALRQEMLDGLLAPGTQLREEKLAARFGVSRSTIREAIRVLTMDGLATRRPNRSVTVHHLTVSEVEDIFAARLVLERAAAQAAIACPQRVLDDLTAVLADYEAEVLSGDRSRAADAHVEFHARLVHLLTGSAWLGESERNLMRHLLLIIASVQKTEADLRAEIDQHRALVELCVARRAADAVARLEFDLMASRTIAVRYTLEARELAGNAPPAPSRGSCGAFGAPLATSFGGR
jgi:DNA-binding GntR family transcriptional regulator